MQLLEDSVEESMEKALSDSDRAEGESKDADAEDNNKARNSLIVWDSCYIMFVICSLPLKPGHSFFVNTQQHVFVLLFFCCYLKNRNAAVHCLVLLSIFPCLLLTIGVSFFLLFLLQKKSSEGGKQGGPLNKKLKKDKLVGATGKNTKSETSMISAAPRVKPELTLPAT